MTQECFDPFSAWENSLERKRGYDGTSQVDTRLDEYGAEEEGANEQNVIYVSAEAYMRTIGNLVSETILHPLSHSFIDPTTGKVIGRAQAIYN